MLRKITIATILALSALPTSAASDAILPTEIAKALETNARRLSPVAISWTERYHSSASPQETLKLLEEPPTRMSLFSNVACRVVWDEPRIYSFSERPYDDNGKLQPRRTEEAFDGRVYYSGVRDLQTTLIKEPMSRLLEKSSDGNPLDASYFPVAGFHLPSNLREWANPIATSEVLYRLARDGKLITVANVGVEGRTLVRVALLSRDPVKEFADSVDYAALEEERRWRTDSPKRQEELLSRLRRKQRLPEMRRFVYLLDPKLHFSIRQWEQSYEPDTPLARCTCTDFEEVGHRGVWLPRKCLIEYFTYDTIPAKYFREPILSKVFDVSSVSDVAPLPDAFVLKYTAPGTRVQDGTLTESRLSPTGYVSYVVPARVEDLDRVVDEARARLRESQESGWLRLLFVLLNAAVVTALLAYVIWRRIAHAGARA